MPIHKTCEECHKSYSMPPSQAVRSRFCSMACRNANDRTAERRALRCAACGQRFTAVQDHGLWPQFCSRECFKADHMPPIKEKACAYCDSFFSAARSSHESDDGYKRYCSVRCAGGAKKRGSEHQCVNCAAVFYLSPSTEAQRGGAGCCSAACRIAYYVGSRSAEFQGGYVDERGDHMTLLARPGYVGKYVGDHRLIASRTIGRLVTRDEFVIRLNRTPEDNRPENLFICESNSEFSRRRNGSLPWPTNSNLHNYKAGAAERNNKP